MEGNDDPKEFPDVSQKLAAPKKLSQFEKDRQAAQAKQQRAEAENAAALRAFESSFAAGDDDDDGFSTFGGGRGPPQGPRGPAMGYGAGRGYGVPPRSGPGSLGGMPGPPPPSLKRKRALDEMREAQEARREQEDLLSYDTPQNTFRSSPQVESREEERDIDAPRPTIHLSSLPPDMTQDEVKSLLRDHLTVQSVRFVPPPGPRQNTKRSVSAIVTLSSEATSSQIDTTISALKGRYVGRGFYLSASRHLSSAAFIPPVTSNMTATSTEPFGAERPRDPRERSNMRNAPPPRDQRGFAPPDSYEAPSRLGPRGPTRNDAVVSVRPPSDIETVKAIHTVIDRLLLEPDPARALQIEAMLMSLPHVQRDEHFAFLFDSQSTAGVYYRFLLWAPDESNDAARENKRRDLSIETIHADVPIEWHPPYTQVPFPDLKSLEQVVTDIDYMSSDESDDEGPDRQFNSARDGDGLGDANEAKHLAPLQRARLVHLLSRLPTTNTKLRKGDVARVTNFAINHAGTGAEEIVDLLLFNVVKPLSYSLASKYEEAESQDEEDIYEPDDELSALDSPVPQAPKDSKRDEDPSNAKLVALYVISDVLSASSTAGARNAWKYRQLFESGFKAQKTFEYLGRLEKELSWGRLKAEQWKRKIGVVFGIWEGWSVFSSQVQEDFKKVFFEPPLSAEEKAAQAEEEEREEKRKAEERLKPKFKRVESAQSPTPYGSPVVAPIANNVPEKAMEEDLDGSVLDDNMDGAPLPDGIDGVPLGDDVDGLPLDGGEMKAPEELKEDIKAVPAAAPSGMKPKASGPKKRMTAADMFGDSSDEGQ